MSENNILTTVVGSYPTPQWLRVFNTSESLRDAMMVVLKTQELAGIDVITDGELSRWDINHPETNGMIDYFIRSFSGIQVEMTRSQIEAFRKQEGMSYRSKPAGIVREEIGSGTLNLIDDFNAVKALTKSRLKFTVTSPYMLGKVLMNEHYKNREELVFGIADVLADQLEHIPADVIQVDEANLTGHPQDAEFVAQAVNRVFCRTKSEKAVHLCFGNYGGQTVQKGTYSYLIKFFNALECDHVVLEMARRPENERDILKDIKSDIKLGVGVIDIKDNQVELPETVAGRIEDIARRVGAERIKYVHPDCGFWMLPRSVADAKMRALVAGRDLFVGDE
jgi:5-methyltetrahydropteroyltriglutamate--homocysteine methyltransferase